MILSDLRKCMGWVGSNLTVLSEWTEEVGRVRGLGFVRGLLHSQMCMGRRDMRPFSC